MTESFEPSDLTTYGAADEEELRSILDAIDRATRDDEPPSGTGLNSTAWRDLLSSAWWSVDALEKVDLPDSPGVYAWMRDDQPIYVGMATSVRKRVWSQHLSGGVSLTSSSLRRNICDFLFQISPAETANPNHVNVTPAQAVAIRNWLFECDIVWAESASTDAARAYRDQLRQQHDPILNRADIPVS